MAAYVLKGHNPNSIGRPFPKGEEHPSWKGGIYSNSRAEYQSNWIRNKRKNDLEFAKRESISAQRWQKAHPIQAAKITCKNRARRKGIPYALTDEVFEALVRDNCYYCGVSPNPINGIDRIDSSGGYIEGNVVTACGKCNKAKNNMSIIKFENWAIKVAQNINERKEGIYHGDV